MLQHFQRTTSSALCIVCATIAKTVDNAVALVSSFAGDLSSQLVNGGMLLGVEVAVAKHA